MRFVSPAGGALHSGAFGAGGPGILGVGGFGARAGPGLGPEAAESLSGEAGRRGAVRPSVSEKDQKSGRALKELQPPGMVAKNVCFFVAAPC